MDQRYQGRRYVIDIETNGLLDTVSKIHTIVLRDIASDSVIRCNTSMPSQAWSDIIQSMSDADELVGHNLIAYDLPVLDKLLEFRPSDTCTITDTLLMSRVVYPDIYNQYDVKSEVMRAYPRSLGSHSLKAWGLRLREHKGDYDGGWEEWSVEMEKYCVQDTNVTKLLFLKLEPQLRQNGWDCYQMILQLAQVTFKMEQEGYPFDVEKATKLVAELRGKNIAAISKLKDFFGTWYEDKGVFTPKRDNKRLGYSEGVPFTKIELTEFNPSSRHHIAKCLKNKYDWRPSQFTPSGLAEINEKILKKLPYPEAQDLAECFLLEKRLGQLADGNNGWLRIQKNGKIHGHISLHSTATGRSSHRNPNLGQVTGVGAKYGKEMRELFHSNGWTQIGCDLSGIELRMLGHFLGNYDNGDYGREVVEGDIHTRTQTATGLPDRASAKRFTYCVLYGGGPAKIGEIVNGGAKEGAKLKKKFFSAIPAFKKLTDDLSRVIKKQGYITGILGHRIPIRSEHSGLNFLLQGSAGTLSNIWLLNSYKELIQMGFEHGWSKDFVLLMHVHDEIQLAVRDKKKADQIGQVLCKVAQTTGTQLKLRVPINAEYKLGGNWAECH